MKRDEMLKPMIAEYRKRIETYQAMIQEWERELGLPSSATTVHAHAGDTKAGLTIDVQPWQFLGKSQPEATKALLQMVGHPLTTEEIIEGIKNGGIEVGAKKFTFYSILNRHPDFSRPRRNTWALSEWPGMSKTKTNVKKVKEKKGGKTRGAPTSGAKKKRDEAPGGNPVQKPHPAAPLQAVPAAQKVKAG